MTRFQDAWLRQQFAPERERFTVESPPDPGHGDISELPNAVIMQEAPVLQGGGEIVTDAVWENYEQLPTAHEIDKTPVSGEGTDFATGDRKGRGYGNLTRPLSSEEGYGRGELGAIRGRNEGAVKDQSTAPSKYQFHNEQWFSTVTEGLDAPPITEGPGDRILRRGLNAYPENDGEGGRVRGNGTSSWTVNRPSWKRGIYFQTNVQRDFSPPNRTHTNVRMVRPDIVTIIGDAPPPDKSDKYASPFSSLQRFLPKRRRLRGIRRVPGPWDEPTIASVPEPTAPMGTADGMVVP